MLSDLSTFNHVDCSSEGRQIPAGNDVWKEKGTHSPVCYLTFRHSIMEGVNGDKIRHLGADYMRRAGPLSRAGSVCQDLGTSVKHIKNQLCDYMEKSQPG